LIEVVDLRKDFIKNALIDATFSDFEDRLQYECAQNVHADYIITRNISDFTNSTITAISPADFITLMVNQDQSN
jgi:sulfur transfer complex TusBCD TusB component (DsrH family)